VIRNKILFTVGGDFLGKWLPVCIAKALPHAECRFVGLLWANGYFVRQEGLPYKCWPWRLPAGLPIRPMPNLTDLHIRGISQDAAPMSVQRSFSTLWNMLESEIDDFKPDAVVYLTAESAIGYAMDTLAREREILSIGLQTSFLRNALLVHTHGHSWWKILRDMPIPASINEYAEPGPSPAYTSRPVAADRFMRRGLVWMSRAERALRALVGAPSFDTFAGLVFTASVKGAGRPGYFPNIGTQDIGNEVPEDFVLVALHRPVLDSDQPTWIDLLRFAVAATPENMLLVVRPHPDEPGSTIPEDLLATLHRRGVRVSRPGKGASLDALLQKTGALLTLTSATGIQALKAGVPTFTIGPAFYARPGMAVQVDVNRPEVLMARLSSGQIEKPDKKTVGAFIAMTKEKYAAQLPDLSAGIIPATELALKIQENFEIHV